MRTTSIPFAIAIAIAASSPSLARAQAGAKKAPPACGVTTLPLQEGNTWTYRSGPNEVVVKVLSVKTAKSAVGKPVTEIRVDEEHGTRTTSMTWTCTAAEGVVIPPESLLFAGEPGGGVGMTMTVTHRGNVTVPPDATAVLDYQWVQTIKADITRAATEGTGVTHPPGHIELERHGLVHPVAPVDIALGSWGAIKMTFELRGRGIVGGEKAEIPVKRPGTFYYVKKLGVVKIEDAFDKTWELASTNLPLPK